MLFLIYNDSYIQLYEVLAEFFSLLGIIVYLELVELNFWNLSYNTKKNIQKRAKQRESMGNNDCSKNNDDEDEEDTQLELSQDINKSKTNTSIDNE